MNNLNELTKRLRLRFPAAVDALLEYILKEAIISFMLDTRIFRDTYKINTQPNVLDYRINTDACKSINRIEDIRILKRGKEYSLGDMFEGLVSMDYNTDVVRFSRDAVNGKQYVVEYSYLLKRDRCDIPDSMYQKYAHVIMTKATSELHLLKDSGSFSPALADRAIQSYHVAVATAVDNTSKNIDGMTRVDTQWFGCGGLR